MTSISYVAYTLIAAEEGISRASAKACTLPSSIFTFLQLQVSLLMSHPEDAEHKPDGLRSQRTGKELKPHRCNDRVEDWVQSLYTLEWGGKIKPAWRNMRACLASEIG